MYVDDMLAHIERNEQTPDASYLPRLDRALAIVAAVSAILAAGTGPIGRLLGVEILTTIWPRGLEPKPNSAIALAVMGLALLLAVLVPRARAVRWALGATISAFGLLILYEYAFGADLGLDDVLWHDPSSYLSGRPPIPAATSFVSLGFAITLMDARLTPFHVVRVMAAVAAIILATAAILGWFIWPVEATDIQSVLGFAPPAAGACLLLGLAVLEPARSYTRVSELVSIAAPMVGLVAMSCLVIVTLSVVHGQHQTRMLVRGMMKAHESIGKFFDLLQDAEAAQRRYLLTGEERHLQPYEYALPRVDSEIARIGALIGKDADRHDRLTRIRSLADERLAELGRAVDLERAGQHDAALALVRAGSGNRIMDQLRQEIEDTRSGWWRDVEKLKDGAERALAQLQYLILMVMSLVVATAAFLLLDGRRRFAEMRRMQLRLAVTNDELDRKVSQRTRELSVALDGAHSALDARAQAEGALRESEERLRFALTSARAGAWRWDIGSGELVWSPEMFALHGLNPSSAGGSFAEWLTSVHPNARAEANKALDGALAEHLSDYRMEYRVPTPSGERWLLGIGKIEYADDGSPIRTSGICIDVTEQKRAESALWTGAAALRRSRSHLRQAANSARLTYADADLATGRISVDENFEKVMGYAPPTAAAEGAVVQSMTELIRTFDGRPSPKAVGAIQALFDGEREVEFEHEIIGDDGVKRWIKSVWRVEKDSDDRPARLFLTNLDVTTLAQAKAEAERANLAKSKFLASASHDLRQPVQSLVLLLALVARQVEGHAKAAHTVELMKQSLEGLNGLLNAILDLSRLDAGAVEPAMETVHLGPLLNRLATEYGRKAKLQKLDLRLVKSDFRVSTDPSLFERMLRNLIENALRYTPSGGVLIGMRRRGNEVRVDVVDTGIGIPVEKQAEIFEEFRQLGNPGRDLGQGLGLGLAIVARLASLVGARIGVSSRPGRGSRFSLTLPLCLDSGSAGGEDGRAPQDAHGSILIIEDNDILRHSLEEMVSEWGYAAFAEASGEEALNYISLGLRVDAIVTDYRLNGLNGIEAALEIERRVGRAVPKLVLTGDTGNESLAKIRSSGLSCLHKPVAADALRRKLADMLAPLDAGSR